MPLHHAIGVCIVIHLLVVFISSDHPAEFVAFVSGIPLHPTHPEPSSVEDDFRSVVTQPNIVTCDVPVLPDAIGNIGTNVNLAIAAPDPRSFCIGVI